MSNLIDFPDATSTDKLGDIFEQFCTSQDLPHQTSGELLRTLKNDLEPLWSQVLWLEAFEQKWREVEQFESDVLKLSRYISAIMREALTAGQLHEVNRLNSIDRDLGCASHDIIDANIVAYGAFAAMFFRELDCADERDTALINAAWDMAMRNSYGVTQNPTT